MSAAPVSLPAPITPEEYLAFERKSPTKHEFVDGFVYAMAGTSVDHVRIATNLVAEMHAQTKGRTFSVFSSDLRVAADSSGRYFYPDVSALCGLAETKDDDNLLNPSVIIEVLSPSTESYDRGAKFEYYRSIPTLQDYVLVSQDHCWIHHYSRQPENKWLLTSLTEPTDVPELKAIGCALPLSDIYYGVETGPLPSGSNEPTSKRSHSRKRSTVTE